MGNTSFEERLSANLDIQRVDNKMNRFFAAEAKVCREKREVKLVEDGEPERVSNTYLNLYLSAKIGPKQNSTDTQLHKAHAITPTVKTLT